MEYGDVQTLRKIKSPRNDDDGGEVIKSPQDDPSPETPEPAEHPEQERESEIRTPSEFPCSAAPGNSEALKKVMKQEIMARLNSMK